MTGTKKIILSVLLLLFLIAAPVAVKLIYFPAVKDAWFQFNGQKLKQVPGGLVIVRVTHYPLSLHKGIVWANVKGGHWVLGRNVTLQQLIATAYDFNPSRVVLPPDAPTNHFDFLVTTSSKPEEQLQAAIRKKFGYVAHPDTQDAAVLVLKVVDDRLPGLVVSDDSERQNVVFENRKIDFKHTQLSMVVGYMEWMLSTPVVDKSGLTNHYDFSMVWNEQTQRQARTGTMTRDTAAKILATWGLGLQNGTSSIRVLAVEKAEN